MCTVHALCNAPHQGTMIPWPQCHNAMISMGSGALMYLSPRASAKLTTLTAQTSGRTDTLCR
jgi:hypothetical protein